VTRLVVSARGLEDLARLCGFLEQSLPLEAARTAELIADGLDILKDHPGVGRPVGHGLRELVISRGRTGYLALYAYDQDADVVSVLGLRHQREAGYDPG
jgi:plasmid stabilization system protein ParE